MHMPQGLCPDTVIVINSKIAKGKKKKAQLAKSKSLPHTVA